MAEGLQTPGFVSGVTQGWLPLGGDMMTLLDACAEGVPISVDVHNARPLSMFTAFAYSGVEGGFSNTSLWAYPFNRARAFGNDSRGFCASGGAGCSPPPPGAPPGTPQGVLFEVPLTCPPLATWLGRLRKNSSFYNLSSPLRVTIAEWVAAFPNVSAENPIGIPEGGPQTQAQRSLIDALRSGDLSQRAALVANLMLDRGGPKWAPWDESALKYYKECAPAACYFTERSSSKPDLVDLFEEAIAVFGGTLSAVVWAFGFVAFWLSGACAALLVRGAPPARPPPLTHRSRPTQPPTLQWRSTNSASGRRRGVGVRAAAARAAAAAVAAPPPWPPETHSQPPGCWWSSQQWASSSTGSGGRKTPFDLQHRRAWGGKTRIRAAPSPRVALENRLC